MTQIRNLLGLALAALAGLCALAPLGAAEPCSELLRRTPPEVSFCLVVRDLRENFAAVAQGPLVKAFRGSKLGQALADSPEVKHLDEIGRQMSLHLGVEWPRIRDEILGDVVVLAYQNGPPGKPEGERALALTWVRDPKLVGQLLERIDEAQKKSGELNELRQLTYRGQSYVHRLKNKGSDDFYFLHGSVLAFSPQEVMIRRVIDLEASEPPSAGKSSPLGKQLEALDAHGAFAALWINPRSFDADLDLKLKQANATEAAFLGPFRACWKALDGVALTVRLERHLEIRLSLHARPDALPAELRRFTKAVNEASPLWDAFPAEPMFAVVGRLEPGALLETLSAFMTPDAHKSLKASMEQSLGAAFGKNTLSLLPDYLGPDFGVCITAPPAGAKGPVPEFLAAVRIRPGKERERVEQSILDALDVVTTLIRVGYNAQHGEPIRLRTARQGDVEVKYLTHDSFPAGIQPAYALKDGFLLVASSPEVIRRTTLAVRSEKGGRENRVLVVSLRHIDRFLKDHGDGIVALLASKTEPTKDEAARQIAKIRTAIELLDKVELLNESAQPGRARLALRIHFTAPLKD